MPRIITRALTDIKVKSIAKPGYYNDGQGLRLQVTAKGTKSWIFRFSWQGKEREMGLGGYPAVKLSDARQRAQEAREKVEAGVDPILDRKVRRAVSEPTEGYSTFWQYAEGRISKWQEGWKNDKHHQQWGNTIKQHGKLLLDMPIDQIETRHIIAVLQPIWTKNQETARRLRGRIETILDAAKVDKLRSGDNPARWVGHLEHILPKQRKDTKGHHEAMPFTDVPAFITRLRGLRLESTSAMALEFTILTAVRSGETRGIQRKEVDLEKRIWTIPKERTKPGRPHRVPLSDQAFEILEGLCKFNNNPDDFLFVSNRGNPLSNMAMAMCLRGLDTNGYTVHGFRSSFRDWAGDETDHAREVAEAALGHIVGDKAEQAYRRGDALDRRRRLMQDWADYVTAKPQTAPPASL